MKRNKRNNSFKTERQFKNWILFSTLASLIGAAIVLGTIIFLVIAVIKMMNGS